MSLTIKKREQTESLTGGSIMLYQETYHAGGDPHKLNVSGVIYMHDFTPPPPWILTPVWLSLPTAIYSMR